MKHTLDAQGQARFEHLQKTDARLAAMRAAMNKLDEEYRRKRARIKDEMTRRIKRLFLQVIRLRGEQLMMEYLRKKQAKHQL